ncbi:MAG: 1-deoxy-D-xylulose-5-phosphate synthase [Lachnospiraceae bacterium]|nr:1-deoxy-D-xylulose-5-phosphate synthase [Lachnospiraceae bacterium]MBP3506447.1 1-deoxy-D-xylulose-5-phosphate synthase [Lachnospiraceae bacterium]
MKVLDKINKPNDIKRLSKTEYPILAQEIRDFILEHVSQTGGHLASNLGTVELTMALHLVLDFPVDKLIWDVGHQAYTHKILTGRKEEFEHLREFGGMSGFPKQMESPCDCFDTGHSSTSISAALGYAEAKEIMGTDESIVAVIGDGALSGGLAYEALNNMARLKSSMVVVLNDNEMSISENVGGMSHYLNKIRTGQKYNDFKAGVEKSILRIPLAGHDLAVSVKRSKDSIKHLLVPGMFFEDMGITYIGPIDGHNIQQMVESLVSAIELERPVVVHVKTVKGKGYRFAEKHPCYFHGVGPFDLETGKVKEKKEKPAYTDIFARKILNMADQNQKIVAITAAMAEGTGLKRFREQYPERFFDVGIAEQHAVTFAAGLAAAGMKPVVAVYSSFLQRAYDQILHDVCIQNLPVIFAIDRSGLVGADGSTHQGIFDISYLSEIPNMTIVSPKNRYELEEAMDFALEWQGPIAIRYPRGTAYEGYQDIQTPMEHGKSEVLVEGKDIAILAVGNMLEEAEKTCTILKEHGINPTLVNVRFIKPFDTNLLDSLCESHGMICTMEENVYSGGYGQAVGAYLKEKNAKVEFLPVAIVDQFVEHGSIQELRKLLNIDGASVAEKIIRHWDNQEEI